MDTIIDLVKTIRSANFVLLPSEVFDQRLHPRDLALYAFLFSQGANFQMSTTKMAKKLSCSRRSLEESLKRLTIRHMLVREKVFTGTRKYRNQYSPLLPPEWQNETDIPDSRTPEPNEPSANETDKLDHTWTW